MSFVNMKANTDTVATPTYGNSDMSPRAISSGTVVSADPYAGGSGTPVKLPGGGDNDMWNIPRGALDVVSGDLGSMVPDFFKQKVIGVPVWGWVLAAGALWAWKSS